MASSSARHPGPPQGRSASSAPHCLPLRVGLRSLDALNAGPAGAGSPAKRKAPGKAGPTREAKLPIMGEAVVELEEMSLGSAAASPASLLVRRRALKRRQNSQSPVKAGCEKGGQVAVVSLLASSAGPSAARRHQRRLSSDSSGGAVVAVAAVTNGKSVSLLKEDIRSSVSSSSSASSTTSSNGSSDSSDVSILSVKTANSVNGENAAKKREVLLKQLQKIKEQSEMIAAKDKKLRELQKENEQLKLRIKHMEDERAVQLKQQASASHMTTPPSAVDDSKSSGGKLVTGKSVIVPPIQKRLDKAVLTDISDVVTPLIVGGQQQDGQIKKRRKRRAKSEIEGRRKADDQDGDAAANVKVSVPKSQRTFFESPDGPYPVLRGDAEVAQEKEEVQKILKHSTEVPAWRKMPAMHASHTMEGTENIEDAALLARHDKLEIDEKRRKRWDIQHIREQRRLAHLKATYQKSKWNGLLSKGSNNVGTTAPKKAPEEDPGSILPALEDITHICVSDAVPVAAFGAPLPTCSELNQSDTAKEDRGQVSQTESPEFKLPWPVS